jgi:hypothetical protein
MAGHNQAQLRAALDEGRYADIAPQLDNDELEVR